MGEREGAQPKRLQVQIDDVKAQGVYANLTMISQTENEFVLDFVFLQPGNAGAKVQSRVVMAPRQAKRLVHALGEAIGHHEKLFGELSLSSAPGDKRVH